MPTFILAGVQRSLVPQVRRAIETGNATLAGWTPVVVPSQHDGWLSVKQVDDVCKRADINGGAHIFALSDDRDRGEVARRLSPYFRFRWFDTSVTRRVGSGEVDPLLSALGRAVTEETLWIETIKPKSSASPLILPSFFKAIGELDRLWRLAESYNSTENTKAAKRLLDRFTREHRRKVDGFNGTPWVDQANWIWDDDGSRHGRPEFPEGWKYSFRLPDGFHFDVKSEGMRSRVFIDVRGKLHPLKKGYLNVTAHGFVRGDPA